MMPKPKLLIFASGSPTDGGSGFENLVNATRRAEPSGRRLEADIVGVVSNHPEGGVQERAARLGIPFIYFPGPYDAEHYASVLQKTAIGNDEWVALLGWMKHVAGLDPAHTFNIHPALLSQLGGRFGGKGMYGFRAHDAVRHAFEAGELSESGFSMHFVTEKMDHGPVFFEHRVPLHIGMSTDDIEKEVKAAEHEWQPRITNLVVHGQIRWDGKDPKSLVVPPEH